jgi:cytochrome c5
MKNLRCAIYVALLCVTSLGALVLAAETNAKNDSSKETTATPAVQANNADAMRVAGEQRFRTNCGRCHAAPQKFPPRMMKTVLRHMRVRATITDEDMKLVLFYMTQ